jgi:hypothetical protein
VKLDIEATKPFSVTEGFASASRTILRRWPFSKMKSQVYQSHQ